MLNNTIFSQIFHFKPYKFPAICMSDSLADGQIKLFEFNAMLSLSSHLVLNKSDEIF